MGRNYREIPKFYPAFPKNPHHMITGTIEKIALYKARFGAIESLDVSLIEDEFGTVQKLIDYLSAKKNNNAKCKADSER